MYRQLEKIKEIVQNEVKYGGLVGANYVVCHNCKEIISGCEGYANKEEQIPMSEDTMFRMFSMTKPVTAVCAMILMEQGKININDPLWWYIPTFANAQVEDENGIRNADRDILLKDLLTMTSGIPYPEDTPAGKKMGELWWQVSQDQLNKGDSISTVEFATEMGKKPLNFTPGAKWGYGASADVMGAVIEIVSGMKLSEFMQKNIFEPLNMTDTGFYIPEEKYHRLAEIYSYDGTTPFKEPQLCLTDYKKLPSFESGGAGLISTMHDYAKFAMMLANGGEYNGVRILGRKTVDFMTSNMLNEEQMKSLSWDSMRGYGYGALMRVLVDRYGAACNSSLGEFGWDGWTGCFFIADKVENLATMLFIQRAGAGTTSLALKMKNIANASI